MIDVVVGVLVGLYFGYELLTSVGGGIFRTWRTFQDMKDAHEAEDEDPEPKPKEKTA